MRKLLVIFTLLLTVFTGSSIAEEWEQWRRLSSDEPQRVLELTEAQLQQQPKPALAARIYAVRAQAWRNLGDENASFQAIQQGLGLIDEDPDDVAETLLRINLVLNLLQQGKKAQAAQQASAASQAAARSQRPDLQIEASISQAQVAQSLGDLSRAMSILETLEKTEHSNNERLQMEFHALLGDVYLDAGAYHRGTEQIKTALAIARQSLGRWDVSVLLYNLGTAEQQRDDYQAAQQHLLEALQISRELNDSLGIAYATQALANIEQRQQHYDTARQQLEQALQAYQQQHIRPKTAEVMLTLAEWDLNQQRLEPAKQRVVQLAPLIEALADTALLTDYRFLQSKIAEQEGNYRAALEYFHQYSELLDKRQRALNNRNLRDLIVRLEIKQQETTNELLKKENQLQQLQFKEQQTYAYFLFTLVVLAVLTTLIVVYLLTRQIRSRKRFARLAMTDELTGAPNRRAIVEQAQRSLAEAKQQGSSVALAIIDFDYFKQVNDRFGHDAGDRVLQRFAQVTDKVLRQGDYHGRLGGEEWLLVLNHTADDHAELIFERLSQALSAESIEGVDNDYPLTFSMGFVTSQAGKDSFERLYKRADEALYSAKHQGRRRLIIAAR
ncbi:tetratricopeptide repeat-containing diguanylate cyclase [Idiomarina xiamenensis]|uniref:diguanylate cyclase n=1 Tax=Idiomarina xiamenensis 10-D-4 TaxID=740709 RepID=K2JLF3_9GAMM|nr:tetratricopeptide repeat-containing diguanylate cyclase [Idiomarina xiamenensis]EKE84301.1 TPR repeat- and GGDEF domain-containing signaling protein [Idiomarina xiamenensis 10-D-4]